MLALRPFCSGWPPPASLSSGSVLSRRADWTDEPVFTVIAPFAVLSILPPWSFGSRLPGGALGTWLTLAAFGTRLAWYAR